MQQQDSSTEPTSKSLKTQKRDSLTSSLLEGASHSSSQGFESVDTIRFIKTNKGFYNSVIGIWLKFRLVRKNKIDNAVRCSVFED